MKINNPIHKLSEKRIEVVKEDFKLFSESIEFHIVRNNSRKWKDRFGINYYIGALCEVIGKYKEITIYPLNNTDKEIDVETGIIIRL